MTTKPRLKPRILLIEDDENRIELFRKWILGSPFALIEATSGGQAMGVLRYGSDGIAGICLDHDLNSRPRTQADEWVSGSDVVNAIVAKVSKRTPIRVHSMSVSRAPLMVKRLEGAGFSATRIRMVELDQPQFESWLEDVIDNWEETE